MFNKSAQIWREFEVWTGGVNQVLNTSSKDTWVSSAKDRDESS